MNAYSTGVSASKRLTYRTPGAVKPKTNRLLDAIESVSTGFDQISASYGTPEFRSERPKAWAGSFSGPATNGSDDFLSDLEREERKARNKAETKAAKAVQAVYYLKPTHTLALQQGPRLVKPGSGAYRLTSGEKQHESLVTRAVPTPLPATFYPALSGERSTKFYSVKIDKAIK